MARPTPLVESELLQHLIDIPLWRRDGATLVREVAAADFASAMGLINSVALLAEKMDHHPDVHLFGWNKVRFTLSTHDQGGITILDIRLAKQIDAVRFDVLSTS
jgi:4a-hydroxytetrahydrobiopterin dehydratase